eukprot:1545633-Prymnesium_polylepis.1
MAGRLASVLPLASMLAWLAPLAAECDGNDDIAMDFAGPHTSFAMTDVNGFATEWPFPGGGSVRWAN